jgi:SET domain
MVWPACVINSRWTIDGTSRKNFRRYANHSCRPNADTRRIGHKVIIRAIKNIRTGAEITYNYGRDYLINVITRRVSKPGRLASGITTITTCLR